MTRDFLAQAGDVVDKSIAVFANLLSPVPEAIWQGFGTTCQGNEQFCGISLFLIGGALLAALLGFLLHRQFWRPLVDQLYSLFGSDPRAMARLPWRERQQRWMLGLALVFTSSLAYVSMAAFVRTIYQGEQELPLLARAAPVFFMLLIYCIDKSIILSRDRVGVFWVRIVIGALVAVFVGSSIAVSVFSSTIDQELRERAEQAAVAAAAAEAASRNAQGGPGRTADLATQAKEQTGRIDAEIAALRAEIDGIDGQIKTFKADPPPEYARLNDQRTGLSSAQELLRFAACLVRNLQDEISQGGGFRCADHAVSQGYPALKEISPTSQGGAGTAFLKLRDVFLQVLRTTVAAVDPAFIAAVEEPLKPAQAAVDEIGTFNRGDRARLDRAQAALGAANTAVATAQSAIVSAFGQIEQEFHQLKAPIGDLEARRLGLERDIHQLNQRKSNLNRMIEDEFTRTARENRQEQERARTDQQRDFAGRHGLLLWLMVHDFNGRGLSIAIVVALLFLSDLMVIGLKYFLKTPAYDALTASVIPVFPLPNPEPEEAPAQPVQRRGRLRAAWDWLRETGGQAGALAGRVAHRRRRSAEPTEPEPQTAPF